MKKDKILKSSLSTLLKRFSNTDIISTLSNERSIGNRGPIPLEMIKDNSILKNARIKETVLDKAVFKMREISDAYPLYVRQKEDMYEVIYPRINYIAARKLKMASIPCYVIDMSDDDTLLFLASNLLQDKDGSIIEMSLIFNKIKKQLKYSQKEIAIAMGLSRSQVTNIMRLNKLPKSILEDIARGYITFGHVRAIATLNEEEMLSLVERIKTEHLSVHDVEAIVYQIKNNVSFKGVQSSLEEKYNCIIKETPKQVSFSFRNNEEKELFLYELLKR